MTSPSDIVERLRGLCTDWNNELLPDGAEPRVAAECGLLREAATLIESDRKALAEAREALAEANAFILAPAEDIKEGVLSRIRKTLGALK